MKWLSVSPWVQAHAEHDALVFDGVGFFDVAWLIFTGQLPALADRYVNIGQMKRSREQVVQLLQAGHEAPPPSP